MSRLTRSWETFKTSLTVVRQDKELLWLPVLSFFASVAAIMGVLGIGFAAGVFPEVTNEDGSTNPGAIVLGFLMYLGLAFVQTYFYAAMVSGANERLGGGDPTVSSALAAANKRLGKLFLWSMVVATVNVIMQALRERAGPLGRILIGLTGMAWNLATYFVVPVLMFEDHGIGGSLKRSGGLFKKNWGESVVGEYGIGLIGSVMVFALVVVGVLLTIGLGSVAGAAGAIMAIVLTVVAAVLLVVLLTVVQAVYKTALYRYAANGQQDSAYAGIDLAHAYHTR
jgi:hypothetical protein